MTIEERFERIEHLTAGIAEERRKDRDEYKTLWRDTQRQINELTANVNRLTLAIADTTEHVHLLADETRARIAELAEQTSAADEQLGARIQALVSAIGQLIASRQ
jgi:methyl-accepting chemotaxis protein